MKNNSIFCNKEDTTFLQPPFIAELPTLIKVNYKPKK